MMKELTDIGCIFRIHLARLRAEAGPFLLAAIVFPIGMYLFSNALIARDVGFELPESERLHFLSASLVFSLSLTAISWFGYLLLENRFTGRLRLFATMPVTVPSYVFGVLIFAIVQGMIATASLLAGAWVLGVHPHFSGADGVALLAVIVFLAVVCLSGISLLVAARARSFSEGSLMTDALGAGLVLIAPIYIPSDQLPRVMQWLGEVLPTTYIFGAIDKVVAGNSSIGGELAILAVMSFAILFAGFSQMRWRDN
jgi:ABC-2 type transport system permease protein